MKFIIADTFMDSLGRLTGEEQKLVKTTAFDLQMNPASPGMSFHKLDKAKDKNFWSVRVGSDIRLIVHKTDSSMLLCYADHHDRAYNWAERRKLETHPKTGAAQLVEIRETLKEILVPVYVQSGIIQPPKLTPLPILAGISDSRFLEYGVPPEWIADVKSVTSEDALLAVVEHLPAEAAEALLQLATGGQTKIPRPVPAASNPFEHPDALRRFRVMTNLEELQRALEYPWDKWTVFLHPEQREWVEKDYSGPARVSGSAGTGKTIVALHRAVHLARSHPEARVLLTTLTDTLASALHAKLRRLLGTEPRLAERIDICSIDAIGLRLSKPIFGKIEIVTLQALDNLIQQASKLIENNKFSQQFLLTEWMHVVDAWQLRTWEEYRDVVRLGRKTRLPEIQRKALWSIFKSVQDGLRANRLMTFSELFSQLAITLSNIKTMPFDFVVVDEAQDLNIAHLRFLAALGEGRPNALFFAGDLGQRIFQLPFSWRALGIDVRGRSRTLRVNYRTSHQIRIQADRLLDSRMTDIDGEEDCRNDTVSVFNGPPPEIVSFQEEKDEIEAVSKWIGKHSKAGVLPHEFGVFVRTSLQFDRAKAAVKAAGLAFKLLDEHVETSSGFVSIGTMHSAKGMEFRAVVVMACDDEIIPLQERIEEVGEEADLKDVYNTERQLLYVACTRARDHLMVTSIEPPSEFLSDLTAPPQSQHQ